MKKLYDLCRKYDLEITITNATYGESVSFRFYDKKNHKCFCYIVTDEMMYLPALALEDVLCNKVIEELGLDKDLWAEERTYETYEICERCNGRGKITEMDALIPYNFHNSVCPDCNGEGKIKIGYR